MESVRVQICYFPFVWVNYLFTILVLKIWDKNICSIFGGLYIIIYFREKYFYVKSMEKEIEEFKEVAGKKLQYKFISRIYNSLFLIYLSLMIVVLNFLS